MSIPGSISTNTNLMNTNLHQQFLFDNLKNHYSNKISSTSNVSLNPNLLRELNARYLHDMKTNGFSTFLRSKHYHPEQNFNISTPGKKSNKWCAAHVRISWMIYHQQQCLKDKLSFLDKKKAEERQISLNNKLSHFISNTKPILPFYRSSFGGLGSLFPSNGKSDINEPIPSSRFHHGIESFSSKNFDEINRQNVSSSLNNTDDRRNLSHHLTNQNSPSLLSRKSNSDNSKLSSHSLPSTFPTFDPLTLSIIERQRLSVAYASLFASGSQGKHFLPINLDPSAMTALIQREQFINSLRLSQQQTIERGTILNNNPKTLKTKLDQISPINNEETKRIKIDNTISPASSSSSIKSKHVQREKRLSSSPSIDSNIQSRHLASKEESIPSISIST